MNGSGSRLWIICAGVFGALGVAMGAFGAHAPSAVLPLLVMPVFENAVRYQLFHALALLGCGVLMEVFPQRGSRLRWAGALFVLGILLFSGSLYGLSLSDLRVLRWLTPLGGLSWIVAWALLALAFVRREGG